MSREVHVRFWEGLEVRFLRATHLIITGSSKDLLETQVKPLVESFLFERGLELSPEKTGITYVTEGFDFLGQNIRRYPNGKLLIKPSRKSVKSLLTKVKEIVRKCSGEPARVLITRLNPVIRGWANYHRHVVSKRIFARIDAEIFWIVWRWAKARHPNKGLRWIKSKYFERVGTRDWWFSGKSTEAGSKTPYYRLFHASSVRIVRHVLVKSDLNPYDPASAEYLARRSSRQSVLTVSKPWAFAKA